jgi:hypothetical protein
LGHDQRAALTVELGDVRSAVLVDRLQILESDNFFRDQFQKQETKATDVPSFPIMDVFGFSTFLN